MPKPLTPEQLEVLRAVPPSATGTTNRLRVAIALTEVKQADVAEETGISGPNLSSLVTGRRPGLNLETARKLAAFFGCAIEDLFPVRDGGA